MIKKKQFLNILHLTLQLPQNNLNSIYVIFEETQYNLQYYLSYIQKWM